MKTPSLWQKLTSAFKRPDHTPPAEKTTHREPEHTEGPESITYGDSHMPSPTAFKRRKRRKRLENRARARMYRERSRG